MVMEILKFVSVKNKKIFCIIEARMTSGRLKGKTLKKIDKKNYLIDYVIQNILSSKYFNTSNIVLASPTHYTNDILCDYVKKKYNILIYRGSEHNVFERVYDCSRLVNSDYNIRYTADNPFIDSSLIDEFVSFFKKKKLDYLSTRTMDHAKKWKLKSEYPEGLSLEIYKTDVLEKIKKYVNEKNKDYPTWNMYSGPKKFNIKGFKLLPDYEGYNLEGLRLTIDTPKDLKFARKLIKLGRLKPGDNNFYKILKFRKKLKIKLSNINEKSKLAYKIISNR